VTIPLNNITINDIRRQRNQPFVTGQYNLGQEIAALSGTYDTGSIRGRVFDRVLVVTGNNDPTIGNFQDYTNGYTFSKFGSGEPVYEAQLKANPQQGLNSPTGFFMWTYYNSGIVYNRRFTPTDLGDAYTGDFTIELLGGGAIYPRDPGRLVSGFGASGDSFIRVASSGSTSYWWVYINGVFMNGIGTVYQSTDFSGRLWSINLVRKNGRLALFINNRRNGTAINNSSAVNFNTIQVGHPGTEGAQMYFYSLKVLRYALYDPDSATITPRAFAYWQ